jgi:diguanylate cyclase (GGDEF)-like protein
MLGGLLAVVVHYLIPLFIHQPAQALWYAAVPAAAAVAIVTGIVIRRPARPMPWIILAVAQATYVVAEVVEFVHTWVLHDTAYPSVADIFYLAQYPLMVWALVVFVQRRTPGWHLPTMIDAAIVAIGLGLVGWVYVISVLATAPDVTPLARLVSVAYPVMDLLVLVLLLRLALGGGGRSATFYLLITSSTALLVADSIYTVQEQTDNYVEGGWLDAGWMVQYILVGAAALHPSMRRLDERTDVPPPAATPTRIAVLALASLTAPAVLLIQHLRGAQTHIVVVALACAVLFLLVLARMAGLVALQRRLAITDSLTGLYTRGFFQETLSVEAGRAARGGSPLGILLLDADHFKRVNDTYGHPVGDRVLRELAARLRHACRTGDVIARYGGEEFAALLAGADRHTVAAVAERVRQSVAASPLSLGDGMHLNMTVSIGVAVMGSDAMTGEDMVQAADRALYEAKHAGRNQVAAAWPALTSAA